MFLSCRLAAIDVIRLKFNSAPTEHLNDLAYYMVEPEKTDESGLLVFVVRHTTDTFKIFLEEGQFTVGNKIYASIALKGDIFELIIKYHHLIIALGS